MGYVSYAIGRGTTQVDLVHHLQTITTGINSMLDSSAAMASHAADLASHVLCGSCSSRKNASSSANATMMNSELTREFLRLMLDKNHSASYKIRFLDPEGREHAKLMFSAAAGTWIPTPTQNKSSRYYFQDYKAGVFGNRTYFSDFDLEREGGQIKIPHVPNFRAFRTVFCGHGHGAVDVGFVAVSETFESDAKVAIATAVEEGHGLIIVGDDGNRVVDSLHPEKEWEIDYGRPVTFKEEHSADFLSLMHSANGPHARELVTEDWRVYALELLVFGSHHVHVLSSVTVWEVLSDGIHSLALGAAAVLVCVVILVVLVFVLKARLFSRFVQDSTVLREKLSTERQMLRQVVDKLIPPQLVATVMADQEQIIVYKKHITIIFADIVGFTAMSRSLGARALVESLERAFSLVHEIFVSYGIWKMKTIGDAIMGAKRVSRGSVDSDDAEAVCTSPKSPEDESGFGYQGSHETAVLEAGLQILRESKSTLFGKFPLVWRIGIDCGKVTLGVIKRVAPVFDAWGHHVNMASRMESNGIPGAVQFTEDVKCRLDDPSNYEITSRPLSIKGVKREQVVYVCSAKRSRSTMLSKFGGVVIKEKTGEEVDESM